MPNKFNENLKQRMLDLAKEGKTTKQIAYYVGVSDRSINYWMKKDKDFKEELLACKAVADELVEAALFQRAVGYKHPEVKLFFDKESLQVIEHKVTKQYPPDTQAGIFWLKNRDPEKWKEKTEVEHSGKVETLSDEALEKRLQELTGKTKK